MALVHVMDILNGNAGFFLVLGLGLALLWLVFGPRRPRVSRQARVWVVVDGSNILYWKDGTPQIAALREVVGALKAQGLTPAVVLDANAGYLVAGRYRCDFAFGRMLDLPHEQVVVVPKGSPADPTILQAARARKARVVTNDRYRDWAQDFPEVANPGHLIAGGYRAGALWMTLDAG